MIRRKEIRPIVQGDKRVIRGWVMYDWSNSVYQLTITSAILPSYYAAVTHIGDNYTVSFFGAKVINTVLYSWTIASAYILLAHPFSSYVFHGRLYRAEEDIHESIHLDWCIRLRAFVFFR